MALGELLDLDAEEGHGRNSQAKELVEDFLATNPVLFKDERSIPYARLRNSPPKTMRLRTMEFRALLAGLLWKAKRKAPGSEALASALNVLHHLALDGPIIPLHNRLAWHDGAIWLDLADQNRRPVKITKEGWTIENDPPILFRSYPHQLPLPEPSRGGDPWKLLDYLNVREADHLLYMTYVGTLFIPGFPHPILGVYGPQGSTKTTTMTLTMSVVDPSAADIAALPRNERELIQFLDHHYVAYFDNVSWLPDWASDALCRACTGAGFSKRQLYTDDEDFIYCFQRSVGLNGINVAARKPDLLDRNLLIGLEQVPEAKRRMETEIEEKFTQERPLILGGFLDAVVKALNMPEPRLDRTSRMADFQSFGYRMAEALGGSGKEFVAAYWENVTLQAEEAVQADLVAEVLLEYVQGCSGGKWEGSPTQLLNLLRAKAEDLNVSTRLREWPKAPNALTRRLNVLKDSLRKVGCVVELSRVHGGEKRILIVAGKVEQHTARPSPSSPTTLADISDRGAGDGGDDKDDNSQNIPDDRDLKRLESFVLERREVGCLLPTQALGLTEEELSHLVHGSSRIEFSPSGKTIRAKGVAVPESREEDSPSGVTRQIIGGGIA
ncbi:hypothetical protein MUP00_09260 [Candidatus Bathyarchaeota archaeon]|nr:hypothetical protein [Candidatus Bathyarchaeota archaeon]